MPRAKTGVVRRKRHKKIISKTKGYYGSRSKLFRRANEAFLRAGEHAFFGRRLKRRDVKKLWIIRLNAAARENGMKYSELINKLNKANIIINRKVLSELAILNPEAFKKVFESI
jgi:large subunit ribosomal protein L20